MEYELKTLENVLEILHPGKLKRENLNTSFIGKYKRLAHIEKDRIKMQFIKAGFEPGAESRMEIYIRQHQKALVRLADTIHHYLLPKGTESIYRLTKVAYVINFYIEINKCIEHLLHFIEHNCSPYFDLDAKIPEAYRQMMIPEIKDQLKYFQKEFIGKNLPVDLIKVVSYHFEDLLCPDTAISFRELYFIRELKRKLTEILKEPDHTICEELINNQLLYLNFNSDLFFSHYIFQLKGMATKCNGLMDLISFYSLKIKLINQVQMKPGFIFRRGLPSIKDQIGSWISEELYFLEKQQQLLMQVPIQKNETAPKEPKVHTSLSVAHLSLAVKLLIDAKVITNKNSRELMKMVARNFRTDRSEQISEDSLWNKAYNVEPSTLDGVKDVIIGLMNLVRRY